MMVQAEADNVYWTDFYFALKKNTTPQSQAQTLRPAKPLRPPHIQKVSGSIPPGPLPVLLCLLAVGCGLLAVGCGLLAVGLLLSLLLLWLLVLPLLLLLLVLAMEFLHLALELQNRAVVAVVAVVAAAAAAFGGASGRAAGNGVSASGAGAIKSCCCWCCCCCCRCYCCPQHLRISEITPSRTGQAPVGLGQYQLACFGQEAVCILGSVVMRCGSSYL